MAIFQPITSMVSNSLDLYKNICKMSDELGISLVTSRILINRGICDPRQAREFLNPSLDALSNPFDIQDMDKAVKRIEQAVKEGQHVLFS